MVEMVERNQKQLFEKLAYPYAELRRQQGYVNDDIFEKLDQILQNSQNAKILDLGCGSGIPVLQHFSNRGMCLTGVDISSNMISLAKKNVPSARYIESDILSFDYPPGEYHAIISFYCLFLLSLSEQYFIFEKIYQALKCGGVACFSLLPPFVTGVEQFDGPIDFCGSRFQVAYTAPETYREQIKRLGFKILFFQQLECGDEEMVWCIVQKV